MLKIEIHKAVGHGFAFFEESLDYWNSETPEQRGWVFAATRTVELRPEAKMSETLAINFADAEFLMQNSPDRLPWFESREVKLADGCPDWMRKFHTSEDIECVKKRALSVGDVLVVRLGEQAIVLGCARLGFRVLDASEMD